MERAAKNSWHKALWAAYPLSPPHVRTVLDQVTDGVFVVNRDQRIIEFNHAAELLTGMGRREALGKTCTDVLNNRSCGEHCLATGTAECSIQKCLLSGKRYGPKDTTIHLRDGRHRVFCLSHTPLSERDGSVIGVAAVFQDVTELRHLRREVHGRYELQNLIGKSQRMQEVYRLIEQAAESDAAVLIEEDGTGKELVAGAIHHLGHRAGKPFVRVNCSALPETLLESELFGHVKGAFTGAIHDKVGRFQAAANGTLLLDEIAEISPLIQLKLLRFTQDKEFERVGDGTPLRVDVRIIAATNKDLKQQVAEGRFRDDLYYRLRVLPIYVPPLRERKGDIVLLVRHFVEKFRGRTGKSVIGPDPEALAMLMDYPWPGNVRELENAIEHAFVRCQGERFGVDDLPQEVREPEAARLSILQRSAFTGQGRRPETSSLSPDRERESIRRALEATGQNRERAADLLGYGRTTLWRKMKKHGLVGGDAAAEKEEGEKKEAGSGQ